MEAADVVDVLAVLTAAGVDCWLNGGWGVDALVGRQTRPHLDLDLVIGITAVASALDALQQVGFAVDEDLRPVSFTMCTQDGRKVDFHPVTWDEHGDGVQAQPNDSTFTYPAEGFRGIGHVARHPVRCLSVEVQILCHDGYQLDVGDQQDLETLRSVPGGDNAKGSSEGIDRKLN